MGNAVRTSACPECREEGRDSAGDNLVHYENDDGTDAGAYCHACEYTVPSGKSPKETKLTQKDFEEEDLEVITEEQKELLHSQTTCNVEYRGIKRDTNKFFGVRYKVTDKGEVQAMYYPITKKGDLVGYKVRKHPKEFSAPVGYVGKQADFGGQFRFKTCNQTLMIVGGEIDQLSAYQIMREYQIRSGKTQYEPTSVVTSVIGENGTPKQALTNYVFLNQFKKIIVCLDSDEAGEQATQKLIKVLPKGKVFQMKMSLKDPNKYLEQGKESVFINEFFNAKQFVPAGIVTSAGIYDKIIDSLSVPKIPLPPFMSKLQGMLAGGIPLGYIINIGSQSGTGKTTFVNELLYYWIFNSPHRLGVVTMELDQGQYGQVLLSRHIKQKLSLIEDPHEAVNFVMQERIKAKADELFLDETGSPRFHLVDDRDGTTEQLQDTVEQLIVSCGCKVIMFDPLSDILDGMSNDQQAVFMRWQKGMIKSHCVTFINISHVRKGSGSSENDPEKARFITEEDFSGSSTIFKSAGANILMMRNKYAEDEDVRNTTTLFLSKNRWAGRIGPAGELYYDNETHTLHDKESWMKENS